ncbi:MAG: sucrose phosphorylase [Acidimicrobiia bacterium]|nr:sucrose phosphorylase [Acidimicrobiia bacterium]
MPNGPQLITYPDGLGGTISDIIDLMEGRLRGLFPSGVHVLPPFPSSGDRGFAPLRYDIIDPRFGSASDLQELAAFGGLTLDVMVNHISAQSMQFLDFRAHGRASAWSDLFITAEKVFPNGPPSPEELAATTLRRPGGPFHEITVGATGEVETVWATFADKETGRVEQIDLDLSSPVTRSLIEVWFRQLASMGATTVRLDAVGYVTKRAGTSSFMVEPDIWDRMAGLARLASKTGLEVLAEVHHLRKTHRALTGKGYCSYDFVLPALVLHALYTGRVGELGAHLAQSPRRQVTTLDTHDGIPIMPDMSGVLEPGDLERIVDTCVSRDANISRVFNPPPGSVNTHQINVTYRDAAGSDDAYLAARAIQLFAPGLPQIYYVGLLGGRNDHSGQSPIADSRSINRHNYSHGEIALALETPVVRQLLGLVRLRAEHPAFAGAVEFAYSEHALTATWTNGAERAALTVDFDDPSPRIDAT